MECAKSTHQEHLLQKWFLKKSPRCVYHPYFSRCFVSLAEKVCTFSYSLLFGLRIQSDVTAGFRLRCSAQ